MHLQVATVTSGSRTYQYVRLVRSVYKDGRSTKEVIANLGALPPVLIENLRAALAASRDGKMVVLPEAAAVHLSAAVTAANYRYLDVAVCLQLWEHWGLTALLDQLVVRKHDDVSAGAVLAVLTLHRCLHPDSKHKAIAWFETTALPELLGVAPASLNNSRVHRVLAALDGAVEALQGSLARAHQRMRGGAHFAMFLDVTDAWFEGRGCALAERGETKEGLRYRRKIGIVLLCDEHGFPLRWEVVEGRRADHLCMGDLITSIQSCPWVGETPIVCDRAMGKGAAVGELLRSGLRFLTAVPRNEIESHTTAIPYQLFESFEPEAKHSPHEAPDDAVETTRVAFEKDCERARTLARQAGFQEVEPTLYVLELGTAVRPLNELEPQWVGPDDLDPESLTGAASALAWARIFDRMLKSGECKNQAALAKATGTSRARVTEVMNLLKLDKEVQEELLAGEYGPISDHPMRAIVKLVGAKAQREALRAYVESQVEAPDARQFRARKLRTTETHRLRRVAYFNPEILVWQRLKERRRDERVTEFVRALNERLRAPRCRLEEHDVRYEVTAQLSDEGVLQLYDFTVEACPETAAQVAHWRVTLTPNEERRRKRRRYHGCVLLVAHEQLSGDAAALAKLYRAKDVIERDFKVIKSEIELRPLYHRTDAKIRAHVAICMLALLLKRALESRLKAAGQPMTANACLEQLESCQLNRYEEDQILKSYYSVTRPNARQKALLKALGMSALTDEREVTQRLKARGASKSPARTDVPPASAE